MVKIKQDLLKGKREANKTLSTDANGNIIVENKNNHTHSYISTAAGSVGASNLASNAVETAKIKDGAVTSAKIADGTIVNGDIANTTIQGGKLVNGTITATQLASNAVEEAKIKDGAVTTNKLGASAVTSAKIADGTIVNADISSSAAIATSKISGLDTALSGKANKTNGASQITDNNSANYEAIEGEASETQQSLNSKINEHIAQLQQDTSNLVPTDHSSSGQNYGLATASKYGHAKIVTNLTTADADGLVLGAGQGKALKTAVDGKAPTSHTNTGNTATYGKATASVWGHTKAGSVVTADSVDGDVGTDNGFYARATHKHKKSDLYAEASHNHTMSDITDWLNKVYPIGSIYMNATSDKNPSDSSLLGVGTWVQIGQGRMLLGAGTYEETVDGTTQTKTYTGGSTDGSKNAIVVSHHHNAANNTQFISGQDGSIGRTSKRAFVTENSGGIRYLYDTGTSITDSCCTTDQGVDGTDMNMPPYLVVYMWKRTA